MDKEQAKFILQSFRPDGSDAADADFAGALHLAAEDRELGEWLAAERATDAAFADALCEVKIPEDLRQHILAVMRGENPSDSADDEVMDNILRNALEEVQPPADLRDQIIAAMEMQEGKITEISPGATSGGNVKKRSWFKITAIAAAVVLGAFAAFQMTSVTTDDNRLTSHDIQQEAGQILNARLNLDVKDSNRETLNTWLVSRQLPTPSSIPESLQTMKSLGCKEITLPGHKKASMICFTKDSGGIVHLIIIKNNDVKDHDDLPTLDQVNTKNCYHCPKTRWNVARWQDKEHTYILLAKKALSGENEILQYF